MPEQREILHATAVAVEGKAVLIIGPSGSGKSALALDLIALGAELVSDDRTCVMREEDTLIARPPPSIAGLIEARGIGILRLPVREQAQIAFVVDLAYNEKSRLPPQRGMTLLDITVPCLHKVDAHYFPAAIHAYLKGSRIDTE